MRHNGAAWIRFAMVVAIALPGVRVRGVESIPLEVAISTAPELPAVARQELLREASTIWRNAGIRLTWVEDDGVSPGRLRVSVGRRPVGSTHEGRWTVGELLRFDDGTAVAAASITRAEAVVEAAGTGRAHGSPSSVVQHRLGVVLGRAVAHEIGHYLLDGAPHTAHGLMRATFQPGEFTDLRDGTFWLDDASRRRIQARLGAPTLAGATSMGSGAAR